MMTYSRALRVWHLEMVHDPAHAGVYMVLLLLQYCKYWYHCLYVKLIQHLEVATSFGEGRLHSDTEGAVIIWLPILVFWGHCFELL